MASMSEYLKKYQSDRRPPPGMPAPAGLITKRKRRLKTDVGGASRFKIHDDDAGWGKVKEDDGPIEDFPCIVCILYYNYISVSMCILLYI